MKDIPFRENNLITTMNEALAHAQGKRPLKTGTTHPERPISTEAQGKKWEDALGSY